MNRVTFLQARTTSARLPAKVLLPVGGLPMAVLAARRAANTGQQVVVVTSDEASDDAFAETLLAHGTPCFRGSLDDVLGRVVGALFAYPDDTIVSRLTADNVFPDGALIDEIVAEFIAGHHQYLCCNGEACGLPYGVSIEVTRLAHLREADAGARDPHEREHVTPYVIRKFGLRYFEKYRGMGKGYLRCTVDALDDYLVVRQVFASIEHPESASWQELVARLEVGPFQPTGGKLVPNLVFGSAQLGSHYGVANLAGRPNLACARDLLKTAIVNGCEWIDTARAYGESEQVVRRALEGGWEKRVRIITKLSPMSELQATASHDAVRALVLASVFQSCSTLGIQTIDVLMLHRASHLLDWNGVVWRTLTALRAEGVIGELGVSVQNPDELLLALREPAVCYVQLPMNLMDWRWDAVVPQILAAKAARGLIVHIRSALLQGLLSSNDESLWLRANVDAPASVIAWLQGRVARFGRSGVADLCIAYVNALDWVDGICIGMETMTQLHENIKLIGSAPLSLTQMQDIHETRPTLEEETLNPASWRRGS